MSKSEILHQLYEQCNNMRSDDRFELLENAESQEEQDFILYVMDYLLQQRQKKVIAEKRF